MKNHVQSIVFAVSLLATVSLTGCASADRSGGRAYEDWRTSRRVKGALNDAPMYKYQTVNVDTFKGVVQLNGWVDSPDQKRRAVEIARAVPGVAQVIDNLTLKPKVETQAEIPQATGSPTGRVYPGHSPDVIPGAPPPAATGAPSQPATGTESGSGTEQQPAQPQLDQTPDSPMPPR